MNKQQFLDELKTALAGLPQDDIDGRLSFYSEMIDDRIEEGMTEEEAVAGVGSIDEIVNQTVSDIPFTKLVKQRLKPKRTLEAWEIALIILGFPLWLPLLFAAAAVLLSMYIVVWSLIISLWAIEVSLGACAIGGAAAALAYVIRGNGIGGLAFLGVCMFGAGTAIFMFFGCLAASKGILRLTKKAALGVKSRFIKKEVDAQ